MKSKATSRPWNGFVPEEDVARYEAAGFGRATGYGARPALLIIDVQLRTTGTVPLPYWQAIEEFKTSCGERAWQAVEHIAPLLAAFRDRQLPVLYPYVAPKQSYDAGHGQKVPAIMDIASRGYDFVPAIAPREGDILLRRSIRAHSSARPWRAI